jgi:hypothetical protein
VPRRWSKLLLVLTASVAVVVGLIWIGRWTRDWLDRRGHYQVPLANLAVPIPPGLDRRAFLAEVQYLGSLPDTISTMDPATMMRLAAALAAHPWVEQVDRIALRDPGGPRAQLRLRTPALVVLDRTVDSRGVLLPPNAPKDNLLRWSGSARAPAGPAGSPWGDPNVEAAAQTAIRLAEFQDRLRLTEVTVRDGSLVFTGAATLRWGRPGGDDAKISRLKALLADSGPVQTSIDLESK